MPTHTHRSTRRGLSTGSIPVSKKPRLSASCWVFLDSYNPDALFAALSTPGLGVHHVFIRHEPCSHLSEILLRLAAPWSVWSPSAPVQVPDPPPQLAVCNFRVPKSLLTFLGTCKVDFLLSTANFRDRVVSPWRLFNFDKVKHSDHSGVTATTVTFHLAYNDISLPRMGDKVVSEIFM